MNYKQHKKKWIDCKKCVLCEKRNRVVLARGCLPCDILFVGEAPGVSEDVLGRPFIGPAGKLLDSIIDSVVEIRGARTAFTNLVCCIPKNDGGNKVGEPAKESIDSCAERLKQMVLIANPKVIVAVGKLAKKHVAIICEGIKAISIIHPAAILRLDISQQSLAVHRVKLQLEDLIDCL